MKIKWSNLFSIRMWIGAAITTSILLVLAEWLLGFIGVPEHVSQYLAYPILAGIVFVFLLDTSLICPKCGRAVRSGYAVCSHCTYDQKKGAAV